MAAVVERARELAALFSAALSDALLVSTKVFGRGVVLVLGVLQ
jgi:hypothetical protein